MKNNAATVGALYEAFGKGDIPSVLNYLSDDVQWEQWDDNSAQKSGVPWLQARNGKDGALEFFKIVGGFTIKDFRVLSLMANESQVAAEIIFEADIPSTGGHFRDEEVHLWTFDEQGKVIRMRHYSDTAKHMLAAAQSH